jgi:hypothetical protein
VTAIERIRAELEAISGSARTAHTITQQTLYRYLWDSTEVHNTGSRPASMDPPVPADDLCEQVPDEHKAAACMIMLALIAVTRAAGGPACPEMGLPMAYAAEAVLFAIPGHGWPVGASNRG